MQIVKFSEYLPSIVLPHILPSLLPHDQVKPDQHVSHLNLQLSLDSHWTIDPHQSPVLWCHVLQVELTVPEFYHRVKSWYCVIENLEVTVWVSSHMHWEFGPSNYNDLLPAAFPESLKHNIWLLGNLIIRQPQDSSFILYHERIGHLANFTLHFGPLIRVHEILCLLFQVTVHPCLETAQMHVLACAFAVAWVE